MKIQIGDRLRQLREAKNLTHGDVEKRTGLLRCYLSRVEHGHTVPGVVTLEKLARALEIPLYQIFYDGPEPEVLPVIREQAAKEETLWGSSGKDAASLKALRRWLARMDEKDRQTLLSMAQKMWRSQGI
jgi:transcriptional regulator with XRE-family HTH domain